MRAAIVTLIVLVVLSCHSASQPPTPVLNVPVSAPAFVLDTAAAYRTAIADHILAMDTSTAPLPDTVYIGRHWDFPPIELPAVIARRSVRIVDPAVGESEKHRTHFAYLNIFATFTPGQVEFYVVRFAQGLRHKPDGAEDRHLYYRVGKGKEGFVLERVSR